MKLESSYKLSSWLDPHPVDVVPRDKLLHSLLADCDTKVETLPIEAPPGLCRIEQAAIVVTAGKYSPNAMSGRVFRPKDDSCAAKCCSQFIRPKCVSYHTFYE